MRICQHCCTEYAAKTARPTMYCGSLCKQNAFKARKARGGVLAVDEQAAARAARRAAAQAERAAVRSQEPVKAQERPSKLGPELVAQLDALSEEFVRALRTDVGYVIELAEIAGKFVAKREAAAAA